MKHALLLALLLMAACNTAPSGPAQIDPPFPTPGPVANTPHVYPIETGWYNGAPAKYYNLGANTPLNPEDPTRVLVQPVWAFVVGKNPDGSPIPLEGQHNLFDVDAGDSGYTDLWQPHFITPPPDYLPDSITSADALLASGLTIEKQAFFVNCPIVPAGSSLAESDLPLKTAWVKGEEVSYFDFGPTSAVPGKVYVFVTGFDSNGAPQLLHGQHFVFDSTRGESGYSDFWIVHWVLVDAAYQPDSIRTASGITTEVRPSAIVVNYPHQ